MIDGNPNEFIDKMYTGQDIIFIFRGVKYWFQGYQKDDGQCCMEIEQYAPSGDKTLWKKEALTMLDCLKDFQEATIFDGHKFWDIEKEIIWIDD